MTRTLAKYRVEYDEFYDDKYDDPKFSDKISQILTLKNHLNSQLNEENTAKKKSEANVKLWATGDGKVLDKTRREISENLLNNDTIVIGVNGGFKGFLANPENTILPKYLDEFNTVDIPIYPVSIHLHTGETKKGFFINDAGVGSFAQTYIFNLETDKRKISFFGGGIVVNTPVGSTGWAANYGQSILGTGSRMLGVAGAGCRGFDYTHVDPDNEGYLHITDSRHRYPMQVYLDGISNIHSDVQKLIVHPSTSSFKLGFVKEINFDDRRSLLSEESRGNAIQWISKE